MSNQPLIKDGTQDQLGTVNKIVHSLKTIQRQSIMQNRH